MTFEAREILKTVTAVIGFSLFAVGYWQGKSGHKVRAAFIIFAGLAWFRIMGEGFNL